MTVTYKQFSSDNGFKSPGFVVDENGNFSVTSLDATGSLKIDGEDVLSSTTLAGTVVNSSLTQLGTLSRLAVNTTTDLNLTTTADINLTADLTTINSNVSIDSTTVSVSATGAIVIASGTLGSLDNINIGSTTPAAGVFTTLSAVNDLYVGGQNVRSLAAAFAVALS